MLRLTSRSFRVFASSAVVVCVAAPFTQAATVTGRVLDSTTSLPLAGVEVLVDGTPIGETTNLAGEFTAEVDGGDRLFTFRRGGFYEQSIGPRAVAAEGAETLPDARLAPASTDDEVVMLEALEVEGELVKGSSADLKNVRIESEVSMDFLSAEQFSMFSAGDAAEALIRIPGVSVAGGEFAVIRGLSDRYGNTLLNGLKVPSPDPEKQAVQMDIFPTNLIDSIVVNKAFMPNLWGDTSGGSIDMATRMIPEGRELTVSVGTKANSNALGDDVPDYATKNGDRDFWGSGETDRPKARERTPFQVVPSREAAPLGHKLSVTYADRVDFGEDNVFGFTTALVKEGGVSARSGRKTSLTTLNRRPASSRPPRPAQPSTMEQGILNPPQDFGAVDFEQAEFENTLGALASFGFQFSPQHKVGASFLFSQSGIDTVESQTFDPVSNADLAPYRWFRDKTYYRQRNITSLQLNGEHVFDRFHDLELDWVVQHIETYQHEPAYSETTYAINPAGQYVLPAVDGTPDPLERAWNDTDESQNAGRLDATLPVLLLTERESALKVGFAGEKSKRDNTGYNEIYSRSSGSDVVADDPQDLYDGLVRGQPGAAGSSSSEADRELKALYGMAVIELPKNFKLSGGYRMEQFAVTSTGLGSYGNTTARDLLLLPGTSNILGTNANNLETDLDERDLLPALGLSWSPSKAITVRTNYSRTVARPSFREVGAYFSQSFETGNLVLGNPALQPSQVDNYDIRAEWYFSDNPADLFAVSVFGKKIDQPIEKMLFDSATLGRFESWANNPGEADLRGFEIEARKGLGFLGDFFEPFSVGGNYTRIDAEVPLHPTTINQLGNIVYQDRSLVPQTRRLFDQPEWTANIDLNYTQARTGTSVTLSLFSISDVLALPGSGFPAEFDLYEKGYRRLDLGVSQSIGEWTIKFSAKNLLDPERGLIYDPELTKQEYSRTSYRAGRDYSLSVSRSF